MGSMTIDSFKVLARIAATFSKDMGDTFDDPDFGLAASQNTTMTDGLGANKLNMCYATTGTLSASGNRDFDLVGSLKTRFGDTISFAKVKLIFVRNLSTTATIRVGGIGATGFVNWISANTAYNRVGPSGLFLLFTPGADGYAAAAGADVLRLTNESGAATAAFEIVVAGEESDVSSSSSSSSSSSTSSATASSPSESSSRSSASEVSSSSSTGLDSSASSSSSSL
jgi:hypothetical protein